MTAREGNLPLVSVVTPVRNGGRYLAECLESVASQTYATYEHVLFDNASTDDTADIVSRFASRDSHIRLIRSQDFLPIIANWNRALAHISPESAYVTILPADDRFAPTALQQMVEVARSDPAIGVVGSLRLNGDRTECLGLPTNKTRFKGTYIAQNYFREEIFAIGPTGNLIRRDLVDAKVPFFPTRYLHADNAAILNVLDEADFGFVHEVLMFARIHPGSVTSTVANVKGTKYRDGFLMLKEYGPRYFEDPELSVLERRYLYRYYRFFVRSVVTMRGSSFLKYHLDSLREAGCLPTPATLLSAVFKEIGLALANPKRALGEIRLRLGKS